MAVFYMNDYTLDPQIPMPLVDISVNSSLPVPVLAPPSAPPPRGMASFVWCCQSVKFDDLCTNFKDHERLDASHALVTMTLTADGAISGMTLASDSSTGVIPVTIPSSLIDSVRS